MRLLHAGICHGNRRFARRQSQPDKRMKSATPLGNICRCTGYQTIVDGVLLAAEELDVRSKHLVDPASVRPDQRGFGKD